MADEVYVERMVRGRYWSRAEKLRILKQARAPGSSVQLTCAANGISIDQFHRIRRQFQRGDLTGYIPVPVIPEPLPDGGSTVALPAPRLVDVEVPGGIKLRVGEDIEAAALRRLLSALR